VRTGRQTLTGATADALCEAVRSGTLPTGGQLPPEPELVSLLGVSRSTLRETLKILEQQGLIVRRRGRRTYIAEASIVKDLSINYGNSTMITEAGKSPGVREVSVRSERAWTEVAAALGIARGGPVLVVDRVRIANGQQVVWSIDTVPAALMREGPRELPRRKIVSLYQFCKDQLGIRIVRGVAELKPVAATSEMAGKLGVRRGSPLMWLTQTDYSATDDPVMYSVEYHLPYAFVFMINRKGPEW